MWRLCKSLILFLFFFLLVVVIILLLPAAPRWNDSLHYAQIDKDSLLVNVDQPRLILLGGSNVGMSFDSQMLKDSLDINPINAGLHAGFGLKFILDNAVQYIKKGDVVILMPEYEQYKSETFYGEKDLVNLLIDVDPGKFSLIDVKHAEHIFLLMPSYLKIKLLPSSYIYRRDNRPVAYLRSAYNKYGDAVAHWGCDNADNLDLAPVYGEPDDNVIAYLKAWVKNVESQGAEVILSYPVYRRKSYNLSFRYISCLDSVLRANDFNVLGFPEDFVMLDSSFYDTRYHANRGGAVCRTEKVLRLYEAELVKKRKEEN